MKKIFVIMLIVVVGLFVVSCGKPDSSAYSNSQIHTEDSIEDIDQNKLESLLMAQNLYAVYAEYVGSGEDNKLLSSDIIGVGLENNSDDNIISVAVAYVAWDQNNKPIKFDNGSYVKVVSHAIDIQAKSMGGVYNGVNVFVSSGEIEISEIKGVAVSYVNSYGETWNNPYYDEFKELYEGKEIQ